MNKNDTKRQEVRRTAQYDLWFGRILGLLIAVTLAVILIYFTTVLTLL